VSREEQRWGDAQLTYIDCASTDGVICESSASNDDEYVVRSILTNEFSTLGSVIQHQTVGQAG
jgi:hypothetical protein